MLDEPGHFSQYSKTIFRHWGMKAVCPFAWVERRLPLKTGLVAVRVAMNEGAGASVTEDGGVTNERVTSDNDPPSYSQPRKRAWPPPERQLEKVAFILSSHRRVSITQQWQGQLVRPRPHNQTRTNCRQQATTPSPPRSRKTRNQRNGNAIP